MGLFSLIGGIIGGGGAKKASKKAAQLQYDAAMKNIDESARQFDLTRADFAPEQQAGNDALVKMRALLGLDGTDGQQSEIDSLRGSPLYQSLFKNGQDTILASGSATGGLRGGNTEAALYNMGEDTLSRVIADQLGNYGGLVGVGVGADGAVGNFGARAVENQAGFRNDGAGAKATDLLTRAGINMQNWNNAGSFLDDAVSSFIPGGSVFKKFF